MNDGLFIFLGVLIGFNFINFIKLIVYVDDDTILNWEDLKVWQILILPSIVIGWLLTRRLFKK